MLTLIKRLAEHRHVMLTAFLLASLGLLLSCGQPTNEPEGNEESCTRTVGGVTYFWGSEQCFRRLPLVRKQGYWLNGFEISIFSTDIRDVQEVNYDRAFWIKFAGGLIPETLVQRDYRNSSIYKLDFEGRVSESDGFYGGGYEGIGGIYVEQIHSIKLVERAGPPG